MNQLISMWRALGVRRQITVAMATLGVFAAVLVLSGAFTPARMVLLYAGLEGSQSGEVLTALDQRGVPYRVEGGAIMVPESQRDELRMALAADGLPQNGGAGYELLDSISGFGTTSQMFDAAYWRAKEGELARTITGSPGIRAARVHISNPNNRVFRNEQRPTASVSVSTRDGRLGADQAKAIRYMVASAVNGMQPEDVSVIDSSGGMIVADSDERQEAGDRTAALKQSVERLLAARVGPGNAVVELTIDVNTQTESVTERRVDPDSRIAISSETEERNDSSDASESANVTVASNLPEGSNQNGDRRRSETNETRERVNYEVSETTREIHRSGGETKRLTVAVLVNGVESTGNSGDKEWVARSADELDDLHALVESAVGFDEARGDIITIRSLPFEKIAAAGTQVEKQEGGLNLDLERLIQMVLLAVVTLILGLFVVRPILTNSVRGSAGVSLDSSAPLPTGGDNDSPVEDELAPLAISSAPDFDMGSGFPAMGVGDFGVGDSDDDPVTRLKRLIGSRREETVEVLRNWMDGREVN